MASVSTRFMDFLALAAAMVTAFFSLILFRLSFNFACLAFCLARTRVQLVKKNDIQCLDAPSIPPYAIKQYPLPLAVLLLLIWRVPFECLHLGRIPSRVLVYV